jgi:hypothetical protein
LPRKRGNDFGKRLPLSGFFLSTSTRCLLTNCKGRRREGRRGEQGTYFLSGKKKRRKTMRTRYLLLVKEEEEKEDNENKVLTSCQVRRREGRQ